MDTFLFQFFIHNFKVALELRVYNFIRCGKILFRWNTMIVLTAVEPVDHRCLMYVVQRCMLAAECKKKTQKKLKNIFICEQVFNKIAACDLVSL